MKPELSAVETLLHISILKALCEKGLLAQHEVENLCKELELRYIEEHKRQEDEEL